MPNIITSLIGGATEPLSTIVSTAMSIIDRVAPSAEEKAKAQVELLTAQNAITLQMAQIDAENNATARDTIVAEAKSESWLTRNWRPIAMMVDLAIIAYSYVIAPMFGLRYLDIPPQLWQLLTVGLTGYQFTRSGEKMWADYQATQRAKLGTPAAAAAGGGQ